MKKKDGKKMMADGPMWAKGDEGMKMSMKKDGKKDGMKKAKMSKGKKDCKM